MPFNWKAGAVMAFAMLGLGGCTHIASTPDTQLTPERSGEALSGSTYALPMLQYKLEITRSLKRCPTSVKVAGEGNVADLALTDTNLVFQVKAEPTTRYIPSERFTVDYRALSSFLKTTGYGVETYPSGVLKSVNLSAEDHTGEVVKDVASIGLTIATMATGNPLPAIAAVAGGRKVDDNKNFGGSRGGRGRPAVDQDYLAALRTLDAMAATRMIVVCTPEAVEALSAIKTNADAQETATKALAEATKDVERYTLLANLKSPRDADVAGWDDALKRQGESTLEVARLKDERGELDGAVSVKSIEYWPRAPMDKTVDLPPTASEAEKFRRMLMRKTVRTITPINLQSWYQGLNAGLRKKVWAQYESLLKPYVREDGSAIEQREPVNSACTAEDPQITACVAEAVTITASLSSATSTPPDCGTSETPLRNGCMRRAAIDANQKTGRYAYDDKPDPGIFIRQPGEALFVVCRSAPGATGPCPIDRRLVWLDAVAAPQRGQLRFLPFESKPFESVQLSLAMREDGFVEKLSYAKTKAAAVEFAAVASDVATQVQAFLDKREEDEASALTTARAEEIAGLQHEINLLGKRAELLKAQTPESPDASEVIKEETAQIATNTALLEAKLANLKAQAALTAVGGQ